MTRTIRARRVLPAVGLASAMALAGAATTGAATTAAATVKMPKHGVETPPATSLTETGSTLLYPLWNIWAPAYNTAYPHVGITTAGTGSGTGISDASNGTVDIGSSDAYLSPSQLHASPSLLNIPLAISVQIVAYHVPGVSAHLKLGGRLLSQIYRGKITSWDDPAIAAANPGVTLPSLPIVTLHRSDGSGDTFLFSQYLSKADPSGWGSTISFGTTVPWPGAPGALAENGNGGMVSGCKATPGCIAYVGISYLGQALQDGLGYAQLQNAKGHYELPTQPAVAAEAASFVKKTPASGTISLIYGPAADGYPIINYEYAIVNANQPSATKAKAIRSLLEWSVNARHGNSGQYLNQVGFQPLPAKVAAQSLQQIAKIR